MSDGSNSDSFTEVTRTGWGQRIGNSLVGALIGLVLFFGSFVLIYWNEGRAVDTIRALDAGERSLVTVASDRLDPAQEGKLVYVAGEVAAAGPLQDSTFRIGGSGLLRLHRKVEMYQWTEHSQTTTHKEVGGSETKETTYSYTREWSDSAIDSARFKQRDGHGNPAMSLRSQYFDAPAPALGVYRLDARMVSRLDAFKPLPPETSALPAGFKRVDDLLYRGAAPENPAIGDMRVSFEAVPAGMVSIVAAQLGDRLAPYTGQPGREIGLIDAGSVPAAKLFAEARQEEIILTWVLRGVGFLLMLIGIWLAASPLATLVAFLPFLETIVGAGAFLLALFLSIPLTLLTIAIAWFAHRPLIGGGLLVGAALIAWLLHRMAASKTQPTRQARA